MLQSDSIIITEGKIQMDLKKNTKVKEVKMISADSKKVDNINNKTEVMNIY